jgi:tetratricopeptide (TPR) repeat protein
MLNRLCRRCLGALLAALMVAAPAYLLPAAYGAQVPGQQGQESVEVLLSIAESQYEVVKLLIKQGRYERVLPEMRKIYDLNLPVRYEQAVAESASLVAHLLVEGRQYTLAHDVLREALPRMKDGRNEASLLKIQAYVYKSEGKLQEALDTLEKAISVERRLIRP